MQNFQKESDIMRSILKVEFSRLFRRKELYISIAIGIILCIWLSIVSNNLFQEHLSILSEVGPQGTLFPYLASVFNRFIGIDYFALPTTILFGIFPLITVFPYATTYIEDCNSGYIKNIVVRTSKFHYYISKIIVTMFSAAFVVLSIFFFSIVITTMFIPEIQPQSTSLTFPVTSSDAMWSSIYRTHPYVYLLLYSLLDAFFYACFALLALLFSSFIRYRFIVLIIPTILFYLTTKVLSYIQPWFIDSWKWMPEAYLRQYQITHAKLTPILVEMLILICISLLVFFFVGDKKNVL